MKNTYNIGLLRRRILEALPRPLSEFGMAALEAFLSLPGASAWRPERLWLKELSYVFDIGLPFALIGDNPSAKSHSLRVGEAVRFGEYPQRSQWSEIHAAALLSRWGAEVRFVADNKTRAHGLEVLLASGETLDVDVIRGDALQNPNERGRSYLVAVDVQENPSAREDIDANLGANFARSAQMSGALLFEPRFWIGIEQKEWVHSARLNPSAIVPVASELLGDADGYRHALRLPLLV
jgi:hypothetical protein